MKKYIILSLSVLTLLISSCSQEYSLDKSVFVEDTLNPGLPIYSEWGYNTFGAYIDRNAFISNYTDLPSKIIVNSDTLNLMLKGSMGLDKVTLKFALKGYSPANYPDLISLNNTTIDLKNANCIVTLKINEITYPLTIIEGNINFKRVQKLYIDKELTKSILSGYFNFKTFMDGEPVSVENGRFDLGIGYDNFYNY